MVVSLLPICIWPAVIVLRVGLKVPYCVFYVIRLSASLLGQTNLYNFDAYRFLIDDNRDEQPLTSNSIYTIIYRYFREQGVTKNPIDIGRVVSLPNYSK